jgi:hypothetical protein
MLTVFPAISSIISNAGIAVISFDFSLVLTYPIPILLSVTQALTM